MSYVTGVTLHLSFAEAGDLDDLASVGELVGRINTWLKDCGHNPLVRIDSQYGGGKHPQALVLGGGFNYLRDDDFVELFLSMPWEDPENAILILNPEEGDAQIIRGTSGMASPAREDVE